MLLAVEIPDKWNTEGFTCKQGRKYSISRPPHRAQPDRKRVRVMAMATQR